MGKTLVVAEKPSVGKDIARFLNCSIKKNGYIEGDAYVVTWAVGHLVGLKDASEHDESYKKWELDPLPFDFDLRDSLKVLEKTRAQFAVVKSLIHRSDIDMLINAGDAGREGYLLQEWIYRLCGNKLRKKVLWASSFTDEALRKAFSNLKDPSDFTSLLNEAEARAEGDWRLGINYSRALTLTIGNNHRLIYGRCQTILLNQIVLRDLAIENFTPTPYYNIKANYTQGFSGTLIGDDKKSISLPNEADANSIIGALKFLPAPTVISCETKDKETLPPLLYNLAALQKDMGAKYGFTPDKTLSLAQSLYEKHKMLSYPRTDSRAISTDIANEISNHLNALYRIPEYKPYLTTLISLFGGSKPKLSTRYVNDHKVTDHYAIIPTDLKTMGTEYQTLTNDEKKVFDAVTRSFLAMFYPNYKYKATTIIAKTGEYSFISKGKVTIDNGFKDVFESDDTDDKDDADTELLPSLNKGDSVSVDNYERLDKMTKPPARFTDKSIIALMEKNNIGTSATRAEIIKKLQNEKEPYLKREKGKYISTQLGRDYITILPEELKELAVTQRFEDALRAINEGTMTKEEFLQDLKEEQIHYIRLFKATGPKLEKGTSSGGSGKDNDKLICPMCGGKVRITSKGFFCTSESCNFALFPSMYYYKQKISISEKKAIQLLSGKKHAPFRLEKRDGKGTYDVYLKIKLNEYNGKTYVNFEADGFPKKKKKGGSTQSEKSEES